MADRRHDLMIVPAQLRGTAAIGLGAGIALNLLPEGTGIPCPLRTLTGVPCPLCGMTTSVVATLRGDLPAAAAANPAGIALVVFAVIVLVGVLQRRRLEIPLWVGLVVLGCMWSFQLVRHAVI